MATGRSAEPPAADLTVTAGGGPDTFSATRWPAVSAPKPVAVSAGLVAVSVEVASIVSASLSASYTAVPETPSVTAIDFVLTGLSLTFVSLTVAGGAPVKSTCPT